MNYLLFLPLVALLLLMIQSSEAVVGMEHVDSIGENKESKYIVVLERHLTKDHYDKLIQSVKARHDDPGDRRFSARVGSEMKLLKMFTVVDPTVDALAFLRSHEFVKNVEADGVVYAAEEEL